jgi:hypothetical protein
VEGQRRSRTSGKPDARPSIGRAQSQLASKTPTSPSVLSGGNPNLPGFSQSRKVYLGPHYILVVKLSRFLFFSAFLFQEKCVPAKSEGRTVV